MNQLVFIENGQVVTDSLTVSQVFGKRHDNVIRDIKSQIEMAGKDFSVLNFEVGSYIDKNNQERPKYNLTEEAFALVVFSYNTKEAVHTKIKFIQEFKRMKEELSKPKSLSPHEQRVEMLKLALEQEEKLSKVENRVEKLEIDVKERITLESGEQRKLQRAISKKVYSITEDRDVRKLLFAEMYREIRDRFGVASYKDIKSHELESAIAYVNAWIPRKTA